MPEYSAYILSTRPLDVSLVEKAAQKGIALHNRSFIETEALTTIEVQQEIEQAALQLTAVIFTSMNAAEAVTGMLDGHVPAWRIYCMGNTTREIAVDYFGENAIAGTGSTASELADAIIEDDNIEEVIFFCGNRRRQELPDKLESAGIQVTEVTVYETRSITHRISREYDGILFFSPSAVESFFINNELPQHTIVFAIGTTTKETVLRFCGNTVITGILPGKAELAEQAIAYFAKSEN